MLLCGHIVWGGGVCDAQYIQYLQQQAQYPAGMFCHHFPAFHFHASLKMTTWQGMRPHHGLATSENPPSWQLELLSAVGFAMKIEYTHAPCGSFSHLAHLKVVKGLPSPCHLLLVLLIGWKHYPECPVEDGAFVRENSFHFTFYLVQTCICSSIHLCMCNQIEQKLHFDHCNWLYSENRVNIAGLTALPTLNGSWVGGQKN